MKGNCSESGRERESERVGNLITVRYSDIMRFKAVNKNHVANVNEKYIDIYNMPCCCCYIICLRSAYITSEIICNTHTIFKSSLITFLYPPPAQLCCGLYCVCIGKLFVLSTLWRCKRQISNSNANKQNL